MLCIRKRNSSSRRFKDAKTIRGTVSFVQRYRVPGLQRWNAAGYGTAPVRKYGRARAVKCSATETKRSDLGSNFPRLHSCYCCTFIGPVLLRCTLLYSHDNPSSRVWHWMLVLSLVSVLGSVEKGTTVLGLWRTTGYRSATGSQFQGLTTPQSATQRSVVVQSGQYIGSSDVSAISISSTFFVNDIQNPCRNTEQRDPLQQAPGTRVFSCSMSIHCPKPTIEIGINP